MAKLTYQKTMGEGAGFLCGSTLAGASLNGEAINYVRDGSLLKTDARSGSINQTIAYDYNADFNITSLTYSGISQTFGYDNDGLLTNAGSFIITRNTQNGLPMNVSDGTVSSTRTFNGYGELSGVSTTVNGNNAYSYAVPTRDQAGRIIQKIETINGTSTTFDYIYDDNGRLTDVKKNSIVVEHYTYDPNGNRLTETNTLRGINRSYTVSDEDHLITAGNDSYQFDVDGFLMSKTSGSSTTPYQYSSRGEFLSATIPNGNIVTYDHDPAGRRIAKKVSGTITEKYFWQSSTKLLAVYDASDALQMRFTYADSRMPVSMTYNGATYYLMYDQAGSIRAVTDANGSIVKRIDFDTFGNIISDSNPSMNIPFGFAGGLYDRDTGLVRFGARDYDPAIGRWTAKDPIDFAGGDTNLYGYVANDPVNGVDPEGYYAQAIPFLAILLAMTIIVATGMSVTAPKCKRGKWEKNFDKAPGNDNWSLDTDFGKSNFDPNKWWGEKPSNWNEMSTWQKAKWYIGKGMGAWGSNI